MSTETVTLRRNIALSGVVGGLALLLSVAFLVRGSSFFDTVIGLLLLGVAGLNLPAVLSARVPVLVVDQHGIRFRIGFVWRGLPWSEVRQVVIEPAASALSEGRLVVVPHGPVPALDEAGVLSQAHLRWNEYWYGAPISIPLGLTTMVDEPDLAAAVVALAAGRAEVITIDEYAGDDELVPSADDVPADAVAVAASFDEQDEQYEEPAEELLPVLPEAVLPLRDLSSAARVDVRLEAPVKESVQEPVQDSAELHLDETVAEPAVVTARPEIPTQRRAPMIGPKILHAREMLDMSIDELSQRTRIRPHVLEAIEEDDFAPCGGDFYARGHLTAVARVLGLTIDPLMKVYDENYAQAPINARRVFEAELASGLSGGMRATLGGPRWSLVIGAVLSLTMIWSLARLFAGSPEQLNAAPDPGSQVAGLAANHTPITSARMRTTQMAVTATYASTHVVVRDRTDKVLWSGDLAIGRHRKIVGLAPFTVSADNAGAVTVSVKGEALGTVGTAGEADSKTFG